MKKHLFILLLFSNQLSAQNKDPNPHFPKVKISVACTEDFINNYTGKWLIPDLKPTVNDFQGEVKKRVEQINNLVYQTYPQPTGCDAFWSAVSSTKSFADQVKYVLVEGDWKQQTVKSNPVYSWKYSLALCGWLCHGTNEIMNGYPEIGGGSLAIRANELNILPEDYLYGDEWTIDGRQIKKKMPVIGKWKEYDVVATNGGIYANQNSQYFVLISREGMLPYIPITRKQYLDRAMQYITKFYDDLNKKIRQNNEKMPAQFRTPKEEIDHQTTLNTKLKNDGLKKLNDELEKTTNDGFLDAPAVIRIDPLFTTEGPIFQSEEQGGTMLATENPDYMRKDLPKYIPQFFVLSLSADPKGWSKEFKRIVEDNFPVEKLKAMIDK
jgi:hypothetical protein